MADLPSAKEAICQRFDAAPEPPSDGSKLGVSRNFAEDVWPLNGLRHRPTAKTNGWYIWTGTHLSADDEFFVPIHVEHLASRCPAALPYLALPPGWRFLLAPDNEDVW